MRRVRALREVNGKSQAGGTQLAASLLLLISLLSFSRAASGQPVRLVAEPNARITVWVYSYAQVSKQDLGEAERVASGVLDRAGVRAEWHDCPVSRAEVDRRPVCQDRMRPTELALVILPSLASVHPHSGSLIAYSQVFLSSRNSGHYAYLSYQQVEATARRGPAAAHQVLGYVAAHELGHLLLDSDAHSSFGIMRRRLQEGDLEEAAPGGLSFTAQEAQRIRGNAAARMRQRDIAAIPHDFFR